MKTVYYTSFTKIVGAILTVKRMRMNQTQAGIAKEYGTNKSTISRLERGLTEISVGTLYDISNILHDCEPVVVMRLADKIERRLLKRGVTIISFGELVSDHNSHDTIVLLSTNELCNVVKCCC